MKSHHFLSVSKSKHLAVWLILGLYLGLMFSFVSQGPLIAQSL